jgi:hypothetical protein
MQYAFRGSRRLPSFIVAGALIALLAIWLGAGAASSSAAGHAQHHAAAHKADVSIGSEPWGVPTATPSGCGRSKAAMA